jgi:hypothetical protein
MCIGSGIVVEGFNYFRELDENAVWFWSGDDDSDINMGRNSKGQIGI